MEELHSKSSRHLACPPPCPDQAWYWGECAWLRFLYVLSSSGNLSDALSSMSQPLRRQSCKRLLIEWLRPGRLGGVGGFAHPPPPSGVCEAAWAWATPATRIISPGPYGKQQVVSQSLG